MLLCSACLGKTSVVQTERALQERKWLPRDGEVLRFALGEWSRTKHRITHLIVADTTAPGGCAQHVVTTSSDRGIRIWNVQSGSLTAVLHMPQVNSRIDAVCHCGDTMLLVAATQLVGETPQSVSKPAELDWENVLSGGDLLECERGSRSTTNSLCMRSIHAQGCEWNAKCNCTKCQPEKDDFTTAVYFWDWTQKQATLMLEFPDEVRSVRHGRLSPGARGTDKFNSVFSDVPADIGTVLCMEPILNNSFKWACGSENVSL